MNQSSQNQSPLNQLKALQTQGQSVWLDFLSRDFLAAGKLKKLVDEDGLKGVTSNPSIFKNAIASGTQYDESLRAALSQGDFDAAELFEQVAVEDIRAAADILRPVYDATMRADGFVSLEVSPYLAGDTEGTIAEARRLWKAVGRDNLMIKVPGTPAGLPAISRLLGEGINVNITLLFSRSVYAQVAEAYFAGLEHFVAQGGNPRALSSVASFFVSRVDTAVDKLIEEHLKKTSGDTETLKSLRGKIAIANAKLAYQDYKKFFSGPRWAKLASAGARPQRLLWASTSTKNPAYPELLYADELIGPDTVDTLPLETIDAFRERGRPRPSLEENAAAAGHMLNTLSRYGISLDKATDELTVAGVTLFETAFDELLGAIETKRQTILGHALNRQYCILADDRDKAVQAMLEDWRKNGNVRKLWRKDASLWTGADESQWLGWLAIAGDEQKDSARLKRLAEEARKGGFTDAVVLGMGGSSLGAEVFARTFPKKPSYPQLHILDSTSPADIARTESAIDIVHTLFLVSSKSGTTLEPNILKDYFFARAEAALGAGKAGAHFIAITDPGTKLASLADREHFHLICPGCPEIGGRYSVLSDFGLAPAAIMGVDVETLLAETERMVHACDASVPPAANPGVKLGIILGTLAKAGRDKLTISASPAIADFGAWLEQLVAESTGKHGKGIVPIAGESIGMPDVYGPDRIFAHLSLETETDAALDNALARLEQAGHPVIRVALRAPEQIGQEFFRWEMATAVAGAIIGINPFDQPDVEAAKVKSKSLMDAYEKAGALPNETPLFEDGDIAVFADEANARALKQAGDGAGLVSSLKAHLGRLHANDYCALLAYLGRDDATGAALQEMRTAIRDAKKVATSVGFGPRYLHSTGQIHKGGPNSGLFLQITAETDKDIAVPGRRYSFGTVIAAQGRGDFAVLNERGRRALRVHLKTGAAQGLVTLDKAVREALS